MFDGNFDGLKPLPQATPDSPLDKDSPALLESGLQEKQVPPDAQSLIDAYKQYATFKTTFKQLEESEGIDVQQLQPPWKNIAGIISRDKAESDHTVRQTKETDPEKLGKALFEAKDKFDDSAPTETVKAYRRGACLVIVVKNEADLRKALNISEKDDQETVPEGIFRRSTYRFNNPGNATVITQVPTIVVLDQGKPLTETTIRHEENHYHFRTYLDEVHPIRLIRRGSTQSAARETFDRFCRDEAGETDLLGDLRAYARQIKHEALIEAACEMTATGKIDSRDPYVEDYFRFALSGDLPSRATVLVKQVKDEFRTDMRNIREKTSGILNSFNRLEKDRDLVYGTVNMRLLSSDSETIEAAVDSMAFIKMLDLGQEAADLRLMIYLLTKKQIRGGIPSELITEIAELKQRHISETQNTRAFNSYGYKQTRQDGKEFPQALEMAVRSRELYLENSLPIRSRTEAIEKELNELNQSRLTPTG